MEARVRETKEKINQTPLSRFVKNLIIILALLGIEPAQAYPVGVIAPGTEVNTDRVGTGEIVNSTVGPILLTTAHNFTEAQISLLLQNGAEIVSTQYRCETTRSRDSFEAVIAIPVSTLQTRKIADSEIGTFGIDNRNLGNPSLASSTEEYQEISRIIMISYAGLSNEQRTTSLYMNGPARIIDGAQRGFSGSAIIGQTDSRNLIIGIFNGMAGNQISGFFYDPDSEMFIMGTMDRRGNISFGAIPECRRI